MCYLHSLDILHGDLTGGNILLVSSNKDTRGFIAKVGLVLCLVLTGLCISPCNIQLHCQGAPFSWLVAVRPVHATWQHPARVLQQVHARLHRQGVTPCVLWLSWLAGCASDAGQLSHTLLLAAS